MNNAQTLKPGAFARYAKEVDKGDLRIPLIVREVHGNGWCVVEECINFTINPTRKVRETDIVILEQPLPPYTVPTKTEREACK